VHEATIEQRIEHLFRIKKQKDHSPIVVVASLFAERRGQWLTHADVIRLINKRFADSTVHKAFKELSRPTADLNGRSFIDIETTKKEGRGGPIVRGRLSEAAYEKIYTSVTPVDKEPPSLFIGQNRIELPPLPIGDKYLSPKDIINLRNQKCGEEDTRHLLKRMANDIPGADKEAMQKVVEKIAKQQGMEFNAIADQFTKEGQVIFPDGNLARVHYTWKQLHDKDDPYTRPADVLKTHHFGPIPLHQDIFTELSMRELASDENRAVVSVSAYIVDTRQDDARVHALEERASNGEDAAFDELIQVLSSDASKYARQYAAHSLGRLGDNRAIEPLIEAMLSDDYSGVRSVAVERLAPFGYRQEFAIALKDSDPHVRREAANILGRIKDARAIEPLREALDDPDVGVRCETICALGEIGDPKAFDFLIPLTESENESIRNAADKALRNIEDLRSKRK